MDKWQKREAAALAAAEEIAVEVAEARVMGLPEPRARVSLKRDKDPAPAA